MVAGGKGGEQIVGSGSVQQVGGQLAVPDDAAAPAACSHGSGVEGGGIEYIQRYFGVIQQGDQLLLGEGIHGGVLHGVPGLRLHDRALFAQNGGACGHQIVAGRLCGQGRNGCVHLRQGIRVLFRNDAVQPEPGDEGLDLQLLHQTDSGGLVALGHLVGPFRCVDGSIGADGAQRVAEVGILPAGQQIFPLPGLDDRAVQMVVHAVQGAEVLDQGHGGLFADALHTRNVVGGVAHQALHLDELLGLDAVLFVDGIQIHGLRFAAAHGAGGQQHGGGLAHQLQAVAVSRGQKAVVPAGLAGSGQRAQNVVGLPALCRYLAVAQVGEQFFQDGHLLGQLVRHGVAGALVAGIHFVAEGGVLQIEGHGHLVGLTLPEQGIHNIQKAEDGIGIAAVLGGQQLDAVKGTVGNAVAVNDQ